MASPLTLTGALKALIEGEEKQPREPVPIVEAKEESESEESRALKPIQSSLCSPLPLKR